MREQRRPLLTTGCACVRCLGVVDLLKGLGGRVGGGADVHGGVHDVFHVLILRVLQ